jgi:hypothetical protein
MRDPDTSRRSLLGRVVPFSLALQVLILTYAASALAQGPAPAPPTAPPSAETLKNWRDGIARVPPPNVAGPNRGCFTSSYPNTQWQEVPCVAGPSVPFPPARGPRSDTVGGGNDPVVGGTGQISMAVGSFDSVSGVTSVTSTFGADDYSLQLNANVFQTPICSGAGAQCMGWQQFIFSNGQCGTPDNPIACVLMQYWLIGWGSTICPTGNWMYFNNNGDDECYISTYANPSPPGRRLQTWAT